MVSVSRRTSCLCSMAATARRASSWWVATLESASAPRACRASCRSFVTCACAVTDTTQMPSVPCERLHCLAALSSHVHEVLQRYSTEVRPAVHASERLQVK